MWLYTQIITVYEMNHILNCGYKIKWSYYPRSYECNFSNCLEKAEKTTGPQLTISYYLWLHWSVGLGSALLLRGHGFKPPRIPEFLPLLYAIVKIAFLTVRIIAQARNQGGARGASAPPPGPKGPHFDTHYPS